jgi:hypothetical protein
LFDAFPSREPVATPHQVRGRLSLENALRLWRSARIFDPRSRFAQLLRGWAVLRAGDGLSNRIKLMLPVQSPLAKIFSFPSDANHLPIPRYPGPNRGAFRDRHGRRAGDAVDAGGAAQTSCADEALISRTAKSCGPDASTPASSSREASFLGATVTNKPDHRGEHEISR